MRRHLLAFTLPDLIIPLAIVLSLGGLGLPAFRSMILEQTVREASSSLFSSVALARSEAAKRNRPVVVRAREGVWNNGWDMFADLNDNAQLDAGEPLIRQQMALDSVSISANGPVSTYIRFTPTGRAKRLGGAFQAGTLRICRPNADSAARLLILSASGRMRSSLDSPGSC